MGLMVIIVVALSMAQSHAENILIKKLQTRDEIRAEYCRVRTGSDSADPDCGMQYGENRLDLIYLPLAMAQKMVDHIKSAYDKKYYFDLDKKDLFHGHFLARGPQTLYATAEEYMADIQLVLYHSQEYLNNWEEIEGDDPFVPHEQQRSFVGRLSGPSWVEAAIDLIDRKLYLQDKNPEYFLRGYKSSGTIYMNQLNDSLKVSQHDFGHYGNALRLYLKSDDPQLEKCEIFQQTYLLEDPKGRFLSPDGKRFDMTLHCRYRRF